MSARKISRSHRGLSQDSALLPTREVPGPLPRGAVWHATIAALVQRSLCPGHGMLGVRGVHRRPTMRSSGPRGQAMVFPDVLSARGRLTRR
jgi:hypothetical protein